MIWDLTSAPTSLRHFFPLTSTDPSPPLLPPSQSHGTRFVFGITALLPLLITFAALLVDEEPATAGVHHLSSATLPTPRTSVSVAVQRLWGALRERAIWLPTLFIFLWQATPQADSAMFFYTTNHVRGRHGRLVGPLERIGGRLGLWGGSRGRLRDPP